MMALKVWDSAKAPIFTPPVLAARSWFWFHVGVWSSFLVDLLAALSLFLGLCMNMLQRSYSSFTYRQ